jgi:TPR repeat protein
MSLFQLSASQSNSDGQYWQGRAILRDRGILESWREASVYFKESARQGNANGQYWYGMCLRDGIWMSANKRKVAKLGITFSSIDVRI